jgi:hypothetical protein
VRDSGGVDIGRREVLSGVDRDHSMFPRVDIIRNDIWVHVGKSVCGGYTVTPKQSVDVTGPPTLPFKAVPVISDVEEGFENSVEEDFEALLEPCGSKGGVLVEVLTAPPLSDVLWFLPRRLTGHECL